MADSFGLKIGLEGEKEFKKALSGINQSFKVLGSEMKLVSWALWTALQRICRRLFRAALTLTLNTLSGVNLYFTVPQGTPLIALRKKKVGINTPTPDAALHVVGSSHFDGDVRITGKRIQSSYRRAGSQALYG